MTMMGCFRAATLACALCSLGVMTAAAQDAAPPETERLTPPEVVRLFDAYAVVQAQDALGLDTERYGAFVANYRALLETRRRHQETRMRALAELGRLTRNPRRAPDDQALRERLRALDEIEARGADAVRAALVAVEQGLSVLQQAKFRVFEEQMERRKLQLLARARQPRMGRRDMPPR